MDIFIKTNRLKCNSCWHIFTDDEVLMGKNPFQPEFTIYGCPNCKEIEDFIPLCQWGDCEEPVTCGTDYKDDYYQLCRSHFKFVTGDK